MIKVQDRWVTKNGEKSARWGAGNRYRVRYICVNSGKSREMTFPDGEKRVAEAFAASQETHRNEGRQLDVKGGKQLIREFGPAYVKSLVVKESTRERYNYLLNQQVIPYIGGKQLIQCTSTTIQTWVRNLEVDGFSPGTIRLAYDFACAMFKRAIRDRLVSFTPCEEIRLPDLDDNPYWVPEHHQVHQLAAAIDPRHKAAVYLAAGCGLRRGELWGLGVDSIDLDKGVVHVDRQLVRRKGGGLPALVTLKTKAARREVPMPGHVVAALREHLAAGYAREVEVVDETAKVRRGQARPVVTKSMLFVGARGQFLWPAAWNKVWAAARAAVKGMDKAFTIHGLRHYFATTLINGGSNPKRVQKLCGHSNVTITLNTYTHLWKDDDDTSRAILDGAFAAGAERLSAPPVDVVDPLRHGEVAQAA